MNLIVALIDKDRAIYCDKFGLDGVEQISVNSFSHSPKIRVLPASTKLSASKINYKVVCLLT